MQPILDPLFDKAQLWDVAPEFFDERTPGRPVHGTRDIRIPNPLSLRNVLRSRNGNMGTALIEMKALLLEFGEIRDLIAAEIQ